MIAGILVSLAAIGQAARQASARHGIFSNTYTTLDGCRCKTDCFAKVGTGWKCDTCYTANGCGTWSLKGRWGFCDYRPSTRSSFTQLSADAKISYFWKNLAANTTRYPEYPLLANVLSSMRTSFDNYQPEMPPEREKMIHSVGSVCQVDWSIKSSPYTGILGKGVHSGFIRMGGATGSAGGMTPGVGFKFPRSGVHDGDIIMLYSLAQDITWNFFEKNMANHIKPADGVTKVLAHKFKDASQCPYHVGLSDLARYDAQGSENYPPAFPFKLFMTPNSAIKTGRGDPTIDSIHKEIAEIPVGTTLYTMYACRTSQGNELAPTESLAASCGSPLQLGTVKTTSKCTTSWYGDKSFMFRHQRIEEDWLLNPKIMRMQQGYDVDVACAAKVTKDGAPPLCGDPDEAMLSSDA